MTRTTALLFLFLFNAAQARADAVVVRNSSGTVVDVWVREHESTAYRLAIRDLWSNTERPITIKRMPFYVAVRRTERSFSYIGPFARDGTGVPPVVVLDRRAVYETKTRPVNIWNGRRWVPGAQQYHVGRWEPVARLRGLNGSGEHRDSESAGTETMVPAPGPMPPPAPY